MSAVGEALEALLHIMKQLKMPAADNFLPGLERTEITSLTQDLELSLPSEIIELYECRNGILAQGLYPKDYSIYFGYWMLPLQEAVQQYQRISQWEEYVPSWFPILYCDGDYFHVDCQAAMNGKPSVIGAMLESDPKVEYSSLSSMFRTFAECYKEGAFVVTDGDILDYDELKENQISLRYNPDVRFWHERSK